MTDTNQELTSKLVAALALNIEFIDSILPQLKHVAFDIGLLNSALVGGRAAIMAAQEHADD